MRGVMTVLLLLGFVASAPAQTAPETVAVTLRVNDAFVKDQYLTGVDVTVFRPGEPQPLTAGRTDGTGSFAVSLVPGDYEASFVRTGYVGLQRTRLRVGTTPGQVVTTTLSMNLETEAGVTGASGSGRRVRVILNWGSLRTQSRDLDSHAVCVCSTAPPPHVYYGAKSHKSGGHEVSLDVDDTDWAGPETVTYRDPPTGVYHYWVHNYSGGEATIGAADVVVRVLVGDRLAGEFFPPADCAGNIWRPFKEMLVGADFSVAFIPFGDEDLVMGDDRVLPPEIRSWIDERYGGASPEGVRYVEGAEGQGSGGSDESLWVLAVAFIVIFFGRKKKS